MNDKQYEHVTEFPAEIPIPSFTPLSDTNYSSVMNNQIIPALAKVAQDLWTPVAGEFVLFDADHSLKQHPEHMESIHSTYYDWHAFKSEGYGKKSYQGTESRGTIVMLPGYTNASYKFSELVWYFLHYGFSILIVEERGQGFSAREIDDPGVVSVRHWKDYETDVVDSIANAREVFHIQEPLYLYGHSMGGGIAALIIEDYPQLFSRAILSSPMLMPLLPLVPGLVWLVTELIICSGSGHRYLWGAGPYVPDGPISYKGVTSHSRADWYDSLRASDIHYYTNGGDWYWLRSALEMDFYINRRAHIRKITTPTILFQSGNDEWVSNWHENRFVEIARSESVPLRFYRAPRARHEIFADTQDVIRKYVMTIVGFFASAVEDPSELDNLH